MYYTSLTGNVRRFVDKLDTPAKEIDYDIKVDKPFILITYTIGFGEVPQIVQNFLQKNGGFLRGVAVSGNRNWGSNFGKAGDIISEEYNVPLIRKFELSGTPEDVKIVKESVGSL